MCTVRSGLVAVGAVAVHSMGSKSHRRQIAPQSASAECLRVLVGWVLLLSGFLLQATNRTSTHVCGGVRSACVCVVGCGGGPLGADAAASTTPA